MAVTRRDGRVVFTCDSRKGSRCVHEAPTGEGRFAEAVAIVRRKGWHVLRCGASFSHTCPACPVPR